MSHELKQALQFIHKYQYDAQNPIVAIASRSPLNIPSTSYPCYASRIVSLRAYARIESVDEAPLPDIGFEDSEAQKLQKVLDLEWNSPRLQLDLYAGQPNNWTLLGSVSLLNPMGYPYRYHNLLDLYTDDADAYIGEDIQIGVSVSDVGYGTFDNTMDSLTVHAEILRTVTFI